MSFSIDLIDITDKDLRSYNAELYSVNLSVGDQNVNLMHAYMNAETMDLAQIIWPAGFKVSDVEQLALIDFPGSVFGKEFEVSLDDVQHRAMVTAGLTYGSTLNSYNLNVTHDLERYQAVVSDPENVHVARYEVDYGKFSYFFIAQNQFLLPETEVSDAGVLIGNGIGFTPASIEWVLNHHKETNFFKNGYAPKNIAPVIDSLLQIKVNAFKAKKK
jgi:hypothetical protein